MAKRVPNFYGSKVYNLTSGATLPAWISDRKKRELSKDADFRRRIELVQDLEFPTACQKLSISPDGQFLVASGTYQPSVKVYELSELSLKFERRLDCEVVDFKILSEDYSKLVFLLGDRHVEFHAAYGRHFSVRVPQFGRTLEYQEENCELLVGGAGDEVYRLDLAEGRFKAPLAVPSGGFGVNQIESNSMHGLLAAACESGEVAFWDPRTKKPLATLDVVPGLAAASAASAAGNGGSSLRASAQALGKAQASCLRFDAHDGLGLGVGTSTGHVLLYDLRSSKPLGVKEHQNGLPIKHVQFHSGDACAGGGGAGQRRVLSTDAKVVKVWSRDYVAVGDNSSSSSSFNNSDHSEAGNGSNGGSSNGGTVTNIETPAVINDLHCVRDARGDTGLVLVAAEQSRVLSVSERVE
jgi:ribosome biogenesis protein ENP2